MRTEIYKAAGLELQKIAAVSSLRELREKLRPGDIMYTKARRPKGVLLKMFQGVSTRIQGSEYTHVGMYIGDGQVADAGYWKTNKAEEDPTKVHKISLSDFAKRYDFKVLRVRTSKKAREEAVGWVKKQLGKDFATGRMVRLILPFKGSPKKGDRVRTDSDSFFCSELVANAFSPHVRMATKKKLKHIMPGDIFRSPHTKTVASFELPDGTSDRRESGPTKLAKVNGYQQKTEWSCSAGTLKSVLQHYGYDIDEEEIIKAIGARKGRGAETTDIVEGARKLGFDASEGSFASLDQAIETLKEGVPIIADIQSFNYPGKGHYIVLVGFKPDKGFIVMDPNTKGKTAVPNFRMLSKEKLEEIWWDRAMAPPHKLMKRWGVMVRPKVKEKTGAKIKSNDRMPPRTKKNIKGLMSTIEQWDSPHQKKSLQFAQKIGPKNLFEMLHGMRRWYSGGTMAGILLKHRNSFSEVMDLKPQDAVGIFRGFKVDKNHPLASLSEGQRIVLPIIRNRGISSWSTDEKIPNRFSGASKTKVGLIVQLKEHKGVTPLLASPERTRDWFNALYEKTIGKRYRPIESEYLIHASSVEVEVVRVKGAPKAKEKTAALLTESQCRERVKVGSKEDWARHFAGRIRDAAEKTANDPVKEKLTLHGIPLSLEWRKGETRRYFNHNPLKKKSVGTIDYNKKMKADYGYVRGIMDADGEELDVYLGPNRESLKVFVLEKLRSSDGSFDENKIMLGYDSLAEAKKSYLQHQGKDELGKVREVTLDQFKKEFLNKTKVAIFTGSGGGSDDYSSGAPTPPDPSGGKTATGDLLGRKAMRRAKFESASAQPSWGKSASLVREVGRRLRPSGASGSALGALTIGGQVGGIVGGLRKAMEDNEESGKIKRVVKGVGTGALIGALVALGLQRNAVGNTTLPRWRQ